MTKDHSDFLVAQASINVSLVRLLFVLNENQMALAEEFNSLTKKPLSRRLVRRLKKTGSALAALDKLASGLKLTTESPLNN